LSLRLTAGKSSCGRCTDPSAPVMTGSPGARLANRMGGGSGISVPTGRGRLKVAAWMVPNGEASAARARCVASEWRA
jgi:hypothetical protein